MAAGVTAAHTRPTEISDGLRRTRDRIAAACQAVNRDPTEVTLVVVTKTFPVSDIRLLAGLGVRDIGENRDQEAAPKAAACSDLDLTWHFVGQLQTNKARSVARYADVVHSLDRSRVVAALGNSAVAVGREIAALVQVGLDRSGDRAGADVDDVPRLADLVAQTPGLRLAGVMAVAPLGAVPGPAYDRLAVLARRVRAVHPDATWVSAGMSGDLEAAIANGATHVRVGSAILGSRPPHG